MNVLQRVPTWKYGRNGSFGLWVRAMTNGRFLILLYKGVIFSRTTTFVYTLTKAASEGVEDGNSEEGGETGGTAEDSFSDLTFLQKIEPTLFVVPSSGAVIQDSEFPIVIFADRSNVVYSNDELQNFKKFGPVPDDYFYELKSGGPADSHNFPEPDPSIYATEDGYAKKNTQKGLLVPLFRIDIEKRDNGEAQIREVLEIFSHDKFAFEKVIATETEEPEEDCEEGGESGTDAGSPDEGFEDGEEGFGSVGGADELPTGGGTRPCP